MWPIIVFFALLVLLWANSYSQPSVDGYQCQFFDQSGGRSTEIYQQMVADGVSTSSIRDFLSMEDKFLAYEKQSVCNNVSVTTNAVALSQQIKDRFIGYDFKYHDDHVRQMSTPSRLINKNLSCY